MNKLVFFLPFISAIILIPLLKAVSRKTGQFIDEAEKDELKIHKGQMSVLGGLAIMLAAIAGFLFIEPRFYSQIIVMGAGVLVFFLICFWDDFKWKSTIKSRPFFKSSMLVLASIIFAVVLYYSGMGFVFIPTAITSIILSFIYILVTTNSINYQDGADGLAGGMVLISLAGFITLGVVEGNNLVLHISLVFFATVLAFLIFNFPPAKIFMGDSGAYSLGFVLAVLGMLFSKPYNLYSALGPIFIVGLPTFDGVFSNLRRMAQGKSIFFGDRDHFYDKLLKKYSIKKTLFISYSLQIASVALGLIIYLYQ